MNNKRLVIFKTDSAELVLPVTPREYELAHTTAYKKVSICSIGDVYAGGLDAAETVKLISFFPANKYDFANNTDTEPQKYIDTIEKLRMKKTVFQLIISGTSINVPVRVQSFLYGEVDGSNDVEYSITLGIHRELETVEVAGWTVPKRKYDPPKKSGDSKNDQDDEKPRTNQAKDTPSTCGGYIVTNGGRFNATNVEEVK